MQAVSIVVHLELDRGRYDRHLLMQPRKRRQTRSISFTMTRCHQLLRPSHEAITGGYCQYRPAWQMYEEANNLASTIRIGSLSLELKELRSNVVGAQLGQKAISTSLKAGAIGLAIVIIFMIVVYLLPGVWLQLSL